MEEEAERLVRWMERLQSGDGGEAKMERRRERKGVEERGDRVVYRNRRDGIAVLVSQRWEVMDISGLFLVIGVSYGILGTEIR